MLLKEVQGKGFFTTGQGDWDTCLEEYVLCTDGRYHRVDCYGHKMPQYVQPLDLAAAVGRPVGGGRLASSTVAVSDEDVLNEKVRVLRSMLSWEKDMTAGPEDAAPEQEAPQSVGAAVGEVIVMTWPDGKVRRLPRGTTAGSVHNIYKQPSARVCVNNQTVPAGAVLQDGDIVMIG